MNYDDVKTVLLGNEINRLDELVFASDEEKVIFLKNLQKLVDNKVNLKFVNNDLKNMIMNLKISKEIISKLKKFNFDFYLPVFLEAEKSKRGRRIYDDFIYFLEVELGIKEDESLIYNGGFDIDSDTKKKAERFGVKIILDYNLRGKKNTVNDFVLYFNRRLEHYSSILEDLVDADKLMRISALEELNKSNEQVSLIGLVSDISTTKNGHMVFTLEDKSSQVKCFVNKSRLADDSFREKVENICLDEGIGVLGKVGDKIVWVDDIVVVSAEDKGDLKKTSDENYVVCIGDLHIGSKNFVNESFEKFIDWINSRTSNEKLNEIAKKVKFVIVAGDLIEGLGIYPGQKKDVKILSTQLQYERAAKLLSKIPEDKCIICISGNHDTNRLSEPQPKLPYEKSYALYNMKNLINLSNPTIFRLFGDDGLDFYLYHGGSIFYYANTVQSLREKGGAKVPEEIIKYLLEKRHIAPSHGSTQYIPDSQTDPLKIDKMPDFFLCGHTHKMSVLNHKGCSILCCGCWNTISDYQEKMGMYPDVGKCILINTKTRAAKILNFFRED